MSVFTLHGFLGRPTDWDHLSFEHQAIDLFQQPIASSLEEWAQAFNTEVAKTPGPHTLIGYSLGGRLALHALIDQPELWKQATLISTHPGLKTEKEREQRLQHDQQWAERFLTEPWGQLMNAWNAQPVFAGDTPPSRPEKDNNRETLAKALTNYSLGTQKNLRTTIGELSMPIKWVVGAKDVKFTQLSCELVFAHPNSTVAVVPGVGHRRVKESFFQ